jgi:NIMA (never in mitosis gene a)-related kinase
MLMGLKALHDRKVLHRDLKSANAFVCLNGDVKIGDMNVSKIMRTALTYTQTGTPYFASPEIW